MKRADTSFTAASSSLKAKQLQRCERWSSGLASKSAGTWLETCLWSALLVTIVMYQSASRATAHWGEIRSCSNWNILSCAWLDVDPWTHFQLIELFLIEPYSHIWHFLPTVLSFQYSKVLNEKRQRCFLKQLYISKNTVWIWSTLTLKISKCCYFEHNKSYSDFWREGGHAEPWLRFAPWASRTNAMPSED